jgi:hypothetical protein
MKITATEATPEIDNLYLDMNGIIHNCTHANQREVKLTEDEMVVKVFGYLEKLVQIVKPRKVSLRERCIHQQLNAVCAFVCVRLCMCVCVCMLVCVCV